MLQTAVRRAMDELVDALVATERAGGSVMLTAPDGADGDSIGSQLALAEVLRKRFSGLSVDVVNADEVPRRYAELPGAADVLTPEAAASRGPYALALVLDGGRSRIGAAGELFDGAGRKVLFDHHAVGDDYAYDLQVCDPEAAATGELVNELRCHPGVDVALDPRIAENLYVTLIFDTGYFRHSSTTPGTMRMAADLLETGIDFTEIGARSMLRRTFAGLQLSARVWRRAEQVADGQVVLASLELSDYAETGATSEDREGIIDQLFLVEGCEVAILVSEAADRLRVSMRSRGKVDVAELARSLSPHGGGHRKAAGCSLEGTLAEWLPQLVAAVEQQLSR